MFNMFDFCNLESIKNTYTMYKQFERETGRILPDTVWLKFRLDARRVYNRVTFDPLSAPICSGVWRTRYLEGEEGAVDYTIIPDNGETDEEILEYIRNSPVFIGDIYSPYDCTGKWFTSSYYFTRTPCGIVLYHRANLDI